MIWAQKLAIKEVKFNKNFQIQNTIHQLRSVLVQKFESFPTPLNEYSKALILGILDEDFAHVNENIKKLGLLHLFCLSGLHAFFIKKYLSYLLQRFKVAQETINILLLIIFPFYWILGGNNVSLTRAIWMIWLGILSTFLLKNRLVGIESWSIVVICYLIKYPATFLTLGAQLSYLMTFILLCTSETNLVKTSFKLNNFSMPIILNATYQWNVLTTFFSVIFGFIFEKIIFPITLIGALIPFLRRGSALILGIFNILIEKCSMLPTIITFGKLSSIMCLIIILILFTLEKQKFLKFKWGILILIYIGSYISIHYPFKDEVVYFDIGQGDSILIREKFNKEVILIDTGGKLNFKNNSQELSKTQGQTIIANYLLSKGINKISGLYLTHQDTDHVGNFPSIGQKIRYQKIFVPAGMEKLVTFQKRLKQLNQKCEIIPVTTDVKAQNNLKILHPFTSGKGTNEDSLVLYKKFARYRFIFMGDLDQKGELEILKRYPTLKINILKNGHHGSKTSSNPQFIEQIQPHLAIISAGRNNRYHHPDQSTLDTLNKLNIPYLSTARDGMIKITVDQKKLKIEKFVKEKAYFEGQ